jgi:hypothetical protein
LVLSLFRECRASRGFPHKVKDWIIIVDCQHHFLGCEAFFTLKMLCAYKTYVAASDDALHRAFLNKESKRTLINANFECSGGRYKVILNLELYEESIKIENKANELPLHMICRGGWTASSERVALRLIDR